MRFGAPSPIIPGEANVISQNFLRNRAGGELSAEERRVLENAFAATRVLPAGQVIVRQGQAVDVSTLLLEGLMTRHVDGRDGRRHLVCVHIPGDFVDLHAYALEKL